MSKLDFGTLLCDATIKTTGESIVLDIPEFPGQTNPIPAGRYVFPIQTLRSTALPEVWSLDEANVQHSAGFDSAGRQPVTAYGQFWSNGEGPKAQLSRIEWEGQLHSWADSRVIDLTPIS